MFNINCFPYDRTFLHKHCWWRYRQLWGMVVKHNISKTTGIKSTWLYKDKALRFSTRLVNRQTVQIHFRKILIKVIVHLFFRIQKISVCVVYEASTEFWLFCPCHVTSAQTSAECNNSSPHSLEIKQVSHQQYATCSSAQYIQYGTIHRKSELKAGFCWIFFTSLVRLQACVRTSACSWS